MIHWTSLLLGIFLGTLTTWMVYQFKRAPLIRRWHQIGYTIQYMHRLKIKLNDGGTLTSELSEN